MLRLGQFAPQLKLLFHTDRINDWLNDKVTFPILIEIAPTSFCNATCPWCFFSDKHYDGEIDTNILLRTLKELSDNGLKAINWSGGGEPTLHSAFSEFVSYANSIGIKQGLFTNGYKIIQNQEMFDWIRISLTDKGFDVIKKPQVPFGICLNHTIEHTDNELINLCLKAKEFGSRYFQIRPALSGNYMNQPNLNIPTFLKQYSNEEFDVSITDYKYLESTKPRFYDKCYGFNLCPSIDWEGKLITCLYMSGNNDYLLGDLNKDSFINIWEKHEKEKSVSDNCQNCCKNHEINKALYLIKNKDLRTHGDFL